MRIKVRFFAAGDIKSPNSFEMPVRLSAWTNSGSHWRHFREVWYWAHLWKYEKIHVW